MQPKEMVEREAHAQTTCSLNASTSTTPVSPSFAHFARKVRHLADALRPQGNEFHQIGNYEIMAEIGHGGQGVIFQARDIVLKRDVALKVPHLQFLSDPALCERFLREARSLALLDHPHIVRIYEAGEIQGLPYLVFDYCPEGNLTDWLKANGSLVTPRIAATWICQLAQGLQQAHQRNILHRDIKPNNVFIQRREGEASFDDLGLTLKLGDFGLAKIVDVTLGEECLTTPQDRIGTPAYMAPELVTGQHELLCPATDVYSLGVMLYELLTGRPLFGASVSLASRRLLQTDEPPYPSIEQPGIPADLEDICRKCLENHPAQRYQNGGELAKDLAAFLSGESVRYRKPILPQLTRGMKRYRWAIATLACLAVLCIGYFSWVPQTDPVTMVSPIKGHRLIAAPCKEVWAIAFSPDSKLMYIAGDTGDKDSPLPIDVTEYVAVYDIAARRIVNTFPTHVAMIKKMAIVDEGKTLITSSYDGTVEEWNPQTGQRLNPQPVMQLPPLNIQGKIQRREIYSMAVSRDEEWIAVGTKANDPVSSLVMVYNRKTRQHFTLPKASHCNINLITFPEAKNPTYLIFGDYEDGKLMRWEFTQPKATLAWKFKDRIENVAFAPNAETMAVALSSHRIKLFEWPSKRELTELGGHKYEIRKMTFSSNNQRLATVDLRGTVFWWNLAEKPGKERVHYNRQAQIDGLAFSPDGEWLAVGRYDGCVDLFSSSNTPSD